jgi:outer membrane protein assembly factor BamB
VTNIYALQNDRLGICVSRPEYSENSVDFYIVDVKTGKTIKEYKKWICRIPLQINKIEDLLSVNLNVGSGITPYFNNGKIYVGNTLGKDYFEKGSSEPLMEKLSKKEIKNGYKWHLLEYTY